MLVQLWEWDFTIIVVAVIIIIIIGPHRLQYAIATDVERSVVCVCNKLCMSWALSVVLNVAYAVSSWQS